MPQTPIYEADYDYSDAYPLLQTKTYFTTSTFYTTYIDRSKTVTKTRSNIRSNVVTETYQGGQFDYLPAPPAELSRAPLLTRDPEEKYLSLGPNIYGLVKTFYATYTYSTTNRQVNRATLIYTRFEVTKKVTIS